MSKRELPVAPSPMEERAAELEEEFSYDGYQVVRRELFAHLHAPAVTIRRDCVTFNAACIRGLEDVVYIHILINPDTRRMVVKRCDEDDKNALRWCIVHSDKRESRSVTSKRFSAMLYELLGWEENYRYKILGYRIKADGEQIYIFDLLEPEVLPDQRKGKRTSEADGDLPTKHAATPVPKTKNGTSPSNFGASLKENKTALQLNLTDYQVCDEIQK